MRACYFLRPLDLFGLGPLLFLYVLTFSACINMKINHSTWQGQGQGQGQGQRLGWAVEFTANLYGILMGYN